MRGALGSEHGALAPYRAPVAAHTFVVVPVPRCDHGESDPYHLVHLLSTVVLEALP